MKKYLLSFILLTMVLTVNSQDKETLTNESIIQLSKIGLQPSVIINKIHTCNTKFDVTTDDLIKLSNNSVSSEVINEMIKISTEQKSEELSQQDLNNPEVRHAPGIYYFNPHDAVRQLRKVDASVVGSQESHGVSFYGMSGGGNKSNLSGENSKLQIYETSPVFYFYFEDNPNPAMNNWWFASATSPKEFVLVKLNESSKCRSFQTGMTSSGGGYSGGSSGIPERVKVAFDYNEESPGVYKVFFQTPLKSGEYCFVYASTAPDRFSNNKVFDFGIPKMK